ncbi:MAG: hypothetical protein O3A00_04220 [Planctomycetota bacterium]|nr:hypothetical protein [Planctomycetota bacterium]
MSVRHGISFEGNKFWVIHRTRAFGPFDYEWSADFLGMEMTYQGDKFGEFCSTDEYFADLKPFRIPLQVSKVGTLVLGLVMQGLLSGLTVEERDRQVQQELVSRGFGQFARIMRRLDE